MIDFMKAWELGTKVPLAGKIILSKLVGIYIPYTGSINPVIEEMQAGYARVALRDRRRVRNHLDSVHAIALANLGEFSTGLAILSRLSPDQRFVLKELQVKYLKKARGKIVAQAKCNHDEKLAEDQLVTSELFDQSGALVCEVNAIWRVGAKKTS